MDTFTPGWNSTVAITNDTTATAAVQLPFDARAVLITNTSLTARVHVLMTYYPDGIVSGTGTAPTTSTGVPVLPNSSRVFELPVGAKVFRTIATGADGNTFLTPGKTSY